jgi:septum formation protein
MESKLSEGKSNHNPRKDHDDDEIEIQHKESSSPSSSLSASSSKNPLSTSKYSEKLIKENNLKLYGRGGAVAFQRKTNSSKATSGDGPPSSPTDSMLSPCTKKLRRKQSKKLSSDPSSYSSPNISLDFWVPPENVDIILGSSSSSRGQILVDLGWNFKVVSPNIDEESFHCDDPFKLPILLAKQKATAILEKLSDLTSPTVILTCDQIVLYRNQVRNKPINRAQAKEYLMSYGPGDIVQTVSAVVATHFPSGKQFGDIDICTIHWNGIPEEVIENQLLNKEEIYSSCGGILIEDPDFLAHVDHIDGDLDSIRGMPIKTTKRVFRSVLSADI